MTEGLERGFKAGFSKCFCKVTVSLPLSQPSVGKKISRRGLLPLIFHKEEAFCRCHLPLLLGSQIAVN